jgi:hypothetical protein
MVLSSFYAYAIDEADYVDIGSFYYLERVNPMSDKDSSFIGTDSITSKNDDSTLFWICSDKNLDVSISLEEYVGKRKSPLMYRFDKKKASDVQEWITSTSGKGIFMTNKDVEKFSREALKSLTVLFRIEDNDGTTFYKQFDITGLSQALGKLKCADFLFNKP